MRILSNESTEQTGALDHFERQNQLVLHYLQKLSHLDLKVWLVYQHHADNATGEAWPGLDRVAALTTDKPTNSKSRVRKARDRLVELGLLELVATGGGTGRSSRYRVVIPQTGSFSDPVSKGVDQRGEGGRSAQAKGVDQRRQRGSLSDPRTTQRTTQRTTHTTTGCDSPSATKARVLVKAVSLPGFDEFYQTYPPHKRDRHAERAARRIWTDQGLESKAKQIIRSVKQWQDDKQWTKDGGRYVPRPDLFLERGMWHEPTVDFVQPSDDVIDWMTADINDARKAAA